MTAKEEEPSNVPGHSNPSLSPFRPGIGPWLRPAATIVARVALALLLVGPGAARAEDSLALLEQQAFAEAVGSVAPSVVRLETVGGAETVQGVLVGDGPTTGLIVGPEGYIISSAFNFARRPAGILAVLPGGQRVAAHLVATDHSRSLVLLKIDAPQPLPVPVAAPLAEVLPGRWAIAVGRTFDPAQPNVSIGIVSAVDRVWGKAIQTDAKVSPANYGGPLVDVQGRVMGVLVPLSPQASGITAGVDWYDSGIGFAVPLAHIERILPRLRDGQDLHAGLLGVSIRGQDLYSPAALAAVRVGSPAAKAGLRAGDEIISLEGRPAPHQAALKTELGRRYAGDRVRVGIRREGKEQEFEVELVAKLDPYDQPFLGILPEPVAGGDKPKAEGVEVRWVFPASPAAAAGITAGDRIVRINERPIGDRAALSEALEALPVGEAVRVGIARADQTLELAATLGRLPTEIPAELPPPPSLPAAEGPDAEGAKRRPPTGVIEPKLAEFENKLTAYVPADYDPRREYGLVIWLHAAGNREAAAWIDRWKPLCARHGLILLAPAAKDAQRWDPSETAMLRRAAVQMIGQYNVDRRRVVAVGQEAGGAMAWLLAFSARGLVRGVAAIEAPIPLSVSLPETEPSAPLSIYAAWPEQTRFLQRIAKGVAELRDLKFPVTTRSLGDEPRALSDEELAELARWIDALDRI
jgi:serine protease Do